MQDLSEIDKQNIWHPFTPLNSLDLPILIKDANGIFLNTHDGRSIIDAISSWWVNLHGHAHPYIANAIAHQASILEHVIFAGFTHEPAIKLSENLLKILPDNQEKIFFSDNGSTAVEVALKMTIQFWDNQGIQKKRFVAIEGAYHGDTFGAMSVGERSIFTKPFVRQLFGVDFISFPFPGTEKVVQQQFRDFVDSGEVAGFIFEPLLQGAAGMRMYKADLLDDLIGYAQSNNVVCIADEVLTGFGRTGKLFASDYLQVKPDILTLSKGLTGGALPLGVTSCSKNILAAFATGDFMKTFFHGHSYTANPLSCSAANASFDLLMRPDCQERIKQISISHHQFVSSIKAHPKIKDARNLGTVMAIELLNDEASSYNNSLRTKIYPYFLKRNVLLRPLGNVIYILPPYVITDNELQTIYRIIEEFLKDL